MAAPINAAAVAALGRRTAGLAVQGLPASWWGRTPAQICAGAPDLVDDGAVGPVCVLRAEALTHNLAAMAGWCRDRGVELAPHGKTHMAPQLVARQLNAGACAVTVATISQLRAYRAFGVSDFILANELVDAAGLQWVAKELDSDPHFTVVCWVDSVAGVRRMAAGLETAAAGRPVDVCVEVGMPGGRTGCRDASAVDEVARAAADCPALRLIGVAGYEAALGHDVTPEGVGPCHRISGGAAFGSRAVGRRVRNRQRRRDRRWQYLFRRGRRVLARVGGRADRAHDHPQRLLPDPRPRAVRQDVTAARGICDRRWKCGRR